MPAMPAIRLTFIALLLAVCAGCTQADVTREDAYSHGAVQVGLREVRYNLDGGGEVTTRENPPAAVIDFERGMLMVDDARVLLNDEEFVPLPDGAKIVRVHYSNHRLWVGADGLKLHSAILRDQYE